MFSFKDLKKEYTLSELETFLTSGYSAHKTLMHIILCIVIWLLTIPVISPKSLLWGLDDSWMYFINIAADKKFVFGKDVIFTYGPMGFLLYPLNVNNNIIICMLFVAITGVYFFYSLWHYIVVKQKSLNGVAVVLILLFFFRITEIRIYIFSVLMISGMLICDDEKPYFNFSLLCLITSFLWLVKFDIACLGMLVVIIVLLIVFIKDRIEKKSFVRTVVFIGLSIAIIPVFSVIYLIYNPSLSDMISYIKDGLQISSGYNYAMSLSVYSLYIRTIILYSCLYIFSFLLSLFYKKSVTWKMMVCAPFLLFAYKYGIVRCDPEHTYILTDMVRVIGFCLVVALDWDQVFLDKVKIKKSEKIASIILIIIQCCIVLGYFKFAISFIGTVLFLNRKKLKTKRMCIFVCVLFIVGYFDTTEIISRLKNDISVAKMEISIPDGNNLPEKIKNTISDEKTVFYPWDILRAECDDVDFICPPVIQGYSAYTPRLDELNAIFFEAQDAPKYIVFEPQTIDGRYLPWEAPKTTMAIERNYQVVYKVNDITPPIMLLEKRPHPLSEGELVKTEKKQGIEEKLIIPETADYISISITPTITHKLLNIVYRTDPVFCKIELSDGTIRTYRVMPEQLKGDLPLKCDIFSTGERIKSIIFDINTIHYVEPELVLTIYEKTAS